MPKDSTAKKVAAPQPQTTLEDVITAPTLVVEPEVMSTPEIQMADPTSLGQIVPLTALGGNPPDPQKVNQAALAINLKDTTSIIGFGIQSQKAVTSYSDQMLQGVRAKDTGPIGNDLVSLVTHMRGLDFTGLKPGQKANWLTKLLGGTTALTKFLAKYETVEQQVIAITNVLDKHRVTLLRDIKTLDKMYDLTLVSIDDLEVYIAAIEQVLERVNMEDIPAARAKATASGDMEDAQLLQDLTNARDSLERKAHDLRLTRQVSLTSLPAIRLVQDNDKGLAEKIQSQIINTIPLWKQQMAIAVSSWRALEAAGATKMASDFTNQLLVKTSEQVKLGNKAARTEIERSIVDVESVKLANQNIIEAINESITIAEEGKARRAAAEVELEQCEIQLKKALVSAAERQTALARS